MCNCIPKHIVALLLSLVILISLPFVSTSVQAADSGETNVFVTVPWELINRCGHQAVSGPCQAYCWAYCRIILDNTAHTYRDYYVNGVGGVAPSTAGYNDGKGASSTPELLKIVYDNINIGRPVMLKVVGSKKSDGTYNNHYVVAIGYKANSNPNNLSESDIFILDPANKNIKEDAGANETYTYLSSRTLRDDYRYWTAKSGGTSTTSNSSDPITDKFTITYADCNVEIACFNGQTVNLYNNPGDTSRVTYFSKGQIVRGAYCATLSDGSTWYKVSAYHNGADRTFWLKYEVNKMTVIPYCSSHSYDAETCTICGAVLNYDNAFDASAAGTYQVTANTAYVRKAPYQVKDLVRTMNSGETVQVVGSVINSYGNTWLKTSEGYYIHAEKMSKVVSGWGAWGNWSTTPVNASSTREVETRQVLLSEGHTEYRYGRYVDSAGKHDCWCGKYLEGLKGVTGSAILDYSDWSTTQYSPVKTYWTCGFCKGNHANVDHYTADGRAWWRQYILSGGSYYWAETRTVDAVYETQYRYRDRVN